MVSSRAVSSKMQSNSKDTAPKKMCCQILQQESINSKLLVKLVNSEELPGH
jgi:hypothetical protein